ncbi:MAG: tRNA (adenosine(37)-N6)-threonylcarbamoyltransferase complex ATPase subunit type 1 TsaE [Clostridia bacterium]|nr:tRNA (adenosine(37)-N6)-threonylcarbamoyltransferase complex ATPase subunit type 1 TsaE [Clostridia bacterium]
MLYTTKNAAETEALGERLAELLDAAGIARAFIAMRGEMGVGKTAFVRGFARYFNIWGVKSPTYTIVNEHRGRVSLFHFDMYRIESEDDLYSIGFDDYVARDGFAIAEWSENVTEFLPDEKICVSISRVDGDAESREINITTDGIYENIGI